MSRRSAAPKPSLETIAGECLANQSRLISRGISGIYDDHLRPTGLRVSQMVVLVAAGRHRGVTPRVLSHRLCMDRSTLSRNVDRLVARGWLETVPGDDARSHGLRLTAAGRNLLGRAAPLWRKAQRKVQSILGERDAATLGRVGERLRAADVS